MAFDGIVIANIVKELQEHLLGGRINKIAQPEKDALLLTIKGKQGQERLFLSANASLPLIYLTEKNKRNTPDRLEQKKYCPRCKKTTLHKEKTKK